jgi:hypothetical protein
MEPDARRASTRRRALKEGKVVLSDWTVIDCRVRDLSDKGARLEFDGAIDLPDQFRLLVTSSNLLTPAERRWQRGLSAGIRFTGPGVAAPRKF